MNFNTNNADPNVMGETSGNGQLQKLQGRIVDVMSLVCLTLGVPLLFEIYLRDSEFGLPVNFICSTLAYGLFLSTFILRKKLSTEVRAGTILLLMVFSAFFGIFHFGLLGSGILTIQSALLLGGIFLGYRIALWLLPVFLMVLSYLAGGFVTGQSVYTFSVENYAVSWTAWMSWISLFTVYSGGILICFRLIQRNMQKTIVELSSRTSELVNAKIKLENASSTKDRFLEMMSHELRTPINPIIGLAEIMSEQYENDPEACENLTIIRSSAEHLLRLIDQILDATTFERGEVVRSPYWSNLKSVFDALEVPYRRQANDKHVDFELSVDLPEGAEYFIDCKKLEQVLRELTSNAVRFSSEGRVCVSVRETLHEPSNETLLSFVVEDEGIGIPLDQTEQLQNLFTQFDSSRSRQYNGLGIGLAIASKLTKVLGGELAFESEPEKGTRITFSILCEKRLRKVMTKETTFSRDERDAPGLNLLVAEDDFLNRKIAHQVLSRLGAKVTLVEDGQQAVRQCLNGEFTAVFMDVSMPNMDGVEATRIIRQMDACSDLPIIALTAHNSRTTELLCRNAGMNDFLTKPVTKDKIIGALERLHRKPEIALH